MTEFAPRAAEPGDAAVAAGLLHDFNTEFRTPTPGTEVLARRLTEMLARDDVVVLLAGEPAVAVALITFRPSLWYEGPVALLEELYVRPHLRGRGIGGAVLERSVAIARERRAGALEINVDEGDTDARRFYEAHGFSNTEPGETERLLYYFREL
jgi:GNAT superfamily N-acetyltransferase